MSHQPKDIDTRLTKAWTAIDKLSIIWTSDLTDKMKRSFFQAVVVSILLYGCTTWTLTKRLEKKLDGNYTRMLRAILNKSWMHLSPQGTNYTATYLPSRKLYKLDELDMQDTVGEVGTSDVLLWTPTNGDRDEMINHIINECSKLAQKAYKTRQDWVGKVIHWEQCAVYWPSTRPNIPFQSDAPEGSDTFWRNRVGGLGWQYGTK